MKDSLESVVFQSFFLNPHYFFVIGDFDPDGEKAIKVLGREFEGQPFFKRVSLNYSVITTP